MLTGRPRPGRAQSAHVSVEAYATPSRLDAPDGLGNDSTADPALRADGEARDVDSADRTSEYGSIILDPRYRVVSLSPRASRITGYTSVDIGSCLPGLPLAPSPDDPPDDLSVESLSTRMAAVGWIEQNGLRSRKDGTRFWANIVLVALRSDAGAVRGFVMLVLDATAHRQAHEAEARATRAAVELADNRSEFLANASHELCTPLNAILGYSEIALDMDLTPTQREPIVCIRAAAESMLGLVANLLDSAKLARGNLELEITPFNLRESLRDMLTVAALRAHHKGLELCCDV
jgi:PAS domain S-box-containing protein